MKVINIRLFTTRCFFILMNISFVMGLSQLHEMGVVRFLETLLVILGIFNVVLHYIGTMKMKLSSLMITITIILIGMLAYYMSGGPTLIKLVIFIFAIQGVREEEVLKYSNMSLTVAFAIVMLSSILGITEIMYLNHFKNAYRLGFTNPNTVPVVILAIVTGYNIQNEDKLSIKSLILEGVLSFLLYYFCRSRTGAIVFAIYLLLIVITKWMEKKRIYKYVVYPLQYLFIIFAVGSYYVAYAFNASNDVWSKVNTMLSGRLYAWQSYLKYYETSMLGINIDTIRYGALDNAYLQLLVKYGYIVFALYSVMFLYLSRYAYKKERWILLLSIVAYEIYFFNEFGPMLINFCSVLLVFGCILMNERREYKKNRII